MLEAYGAGRLFHIKPFAVVCVSAGVEAQLAPSTTK
jgi:hypothetical protein